MKATLMLACVIALASGCVGKPTRPPTELKHYAMDDLNGLVTASGVRIDGDVTSDGKGSLRIETDQTKSIPLYETGDIDVENARLIYRAKVRCQNVTGKAYLEMRCRFPGKGEFFSKAFDSAISGTAAWSLHEACFFLKQGENPDNVKLNVAIEGGGMVWIDEIRLLRAPLE